MDVALPAVTAVVLLIPFCHAMDVTRAFIARRAPAIDIQLTDVGCPSRPQLFIPSGHLKCSNHYSLFVFISLLPIDRGMCWGDFVSVHDDLTLLHLCHIKSSNYLCCQQQALSWSFFPVHAEATI